MPKLGCTGKIIIAVFVFLVLVIVGLFFPVPRPHIALPAEAVFYAGSFPITNTLLASWISILVLAGIFYLGTRRMKLVPTRLQNAVETAVEMLLNFVEGVAGRDNGRRFFPIVATIFFFVIMNAWLSLLPGFSTIGFGTEESYSGAFGGGGTAFVIEAPLLRAANTDINVPLMLALVSFVFVEYCGIRSLGLRYYVSRFVRIGQLRRCLGHLVRGRVRTAISGLFTGAIDVYTGALEALSELVRIISFTFRLFGNMTAGEVLLLIICFLIPWVVAVPFYGLELFLGFVQAFIFGGLTLVFAVIAVAPHEEPE